MTKQYVPNTKNLKQKNLFLILKLVATTGRLSRADLSRTTGLSKMTITNLVAELIEQGLVDETEADSLEQESAATSGRPPIMLTISKKSPCICGMLVKRGLCQIIISDLSGEIYDQVINYFNLDISEDSLTHLLLENFRVLKERTPRPIIAIGISSVGPLNTVTGTILNPALLVNIKNLPIVSIIQRATGLPTYLINDASAGALAEKLYGIGKDVDNFAYLHIMNGIGSGFVLENKLYDGNLGLSGEIGHSSINFSGPKCSCGNIGCLELYANISNMCGKISELAPLYKASPLGNIVSPDWPTIVDAANKGDALAITVLNEFCGYVSFALLNLLKILDLSIIIVGYDSNGSGQIVEEILESRINNTGTFQFNQVKVIRSGFFGAAPLVGSIAFIANKIFTQRLPIIKE